MNEEIRELLEAILDNQEPIHKLAEVELKRRGITVTAFKRHSKKEPSDIDVEEQKLPIYSDPKSDEVACPEQVGEPKEAGGGRTYKPMKRTDCKERYGIGNCACSEGDTNLLTIRCNVYKAKWSGSGAVE